MGFDQLPEFPNGREVTAESAVPGIPPESFTQALRDSGTQLIESTKRPEDAPAVQAALQAEVDTLAGQLGHEQPPVAPTAPAPPPDTSQVPQGAPAPPTAGPSSPGTPPDDMADRIRRVLEKYSSPEELAKAYVHTDAARTRSQQDRSSDISALRSELSTLRSEVSQRYADTRDMFQRSGPERVPSTPQETSEIPDEAEEFFKKPKQNIGRLVDEVVQRHLTAYNEAQRINNDEQKFVRLREQQSADIERLRPIMNDMYYQEQDLYESLPKDRSLNLLLQRAKERDEALRARQFYSEIKDSIGPNGTPAEPNAAPGTTGALPQGMPGRRAAQTTPSDWSNTQNFNKLWKTRSDSTEEMKSITEILKERGFGEDIPIY